MRRHVALAALALAALVAAPAAGCLAGDAPDDDLAALEAALPDPDDAKADGGAVDLAALRARLHDLLETFSATVGARRYETPDAALAEIRRRLAARGIADPRRARFVGYLAAFPIAVPGWHHSEFLLRGAVDTTSRAVAPLHLRAVGDVNGAAIVEDQDRSDAMSSRMCMTWDGLQAAVRAAYAPGRHYALDFVCHTVSMRVLEAIGVPSEHFSGLVGGWRLARWAYGPRGASGLPPAVADWRATRACDDAAVRASGL